MTTTPDIHHRLDEVIGYLEAVFEGSEIFALGRRRLEEARTRSTQFARDLALNSQGDDPIDVIAKHLKLGEVKSETRERLTEAVCVVLGAYAQALKDEEVTGSRSSEVRALLQETVLDRAHSIRRALRDEVPSDAGAPLHGTNPAGHHAARLLKQAALEIAMVTRTPPQTKPFGPRRPDLRPLKRGLRMYQGRASGADTGPARSLRYAATAAERYGLDRRAAEKAKVLASEIETTLFDGDPVDLLIAAAERALTWLPKAGDTTNFLLSPRSSYTLAWGGVEIVVAFGSKKPSGSDTGMLQHLMRAIHWMARPPKEEYVGDKLHSKIGQSSEIQTTVCSGASKEVVALWREGRAATLFCDDVRHAAELARVARLQVAPAPLPDGLTDSQRRELEADWQVEQLPDFADRSTTMGKVRRPLKKKEPQADG